MKYIVLIYFPDETQGILGMYDTLDEAYDAIDECGHPEYDFAVYQRV